MNLFHISKFFQYIRVKSINNYFVVILDLTEKIIYLKQFYFFGMMQCPLFKKCNLLSIFFRTYSGFFISLTFCYGRVTYVINVLILFRPETFCSFSFSLEIISKSGLVGLEENLFSWNKSTETHS